MNAVELY